MTDSPSPVKYLRILLRSDLIVLLKNKRALIVSVVVPLYLILISRLGTNAGSRLGGYLFLVILSVTVGLLSLALTGYALAVARDRERGVFQRLRVTPAPVWTIMTSRLLIQMLAGFVIALVVLIVGNQVYGLAFGPRDYLASLLVVIVESAVFLSIGQALVGLIKSSTLINAVGGLLYVALLLTGLLGMNGIFGSSFQTFAQWSPVGVVIVVFQSALQQNPWDSHALLSLLACFGYIAVFSFAGIRWFKWDAR